jgi:hypothetical protein
VRDTRNPGWLKDLECTAGILCDAATALVLPKGKLTVVFPIVADASLEELKNYEEFIGIPAKPEARQTRGT